jgi:hypothetical protein
MQNMVYKYAFSNVSIQIPKDADSQPDLFRNAVQSVRSLSLMCYQIRYEVANINFRDLTLDLTDSSDPEFATFAGYTEDTRYAVQCIKISQIAGLMIANNCMWEYSTLPEGMQQKFSALQEMVLASSFGLVDTDGSLEQGLRDFLHKCGIALEIGDDGKYTCQMSRRTKGGS